MSHSSPITHHPSLTTPRSMALAMTLLALLCIVIGLVPGLVIPLTYGGVGQLLADTTGTLGTAMAATVAPAGHLTLLAIILTALIVTLLAIRAIVRRRNAPIHTGVATWGCGYAYGSPRVQYTASSFAWSLIASFERVLWPQRQLHPPVG